MSLFHGHREPVERLYNKRPPGFELRWCACQGWHVWHRVWFESGFGWSARCTNCGAEKDGLR